MCHKESWGAIFATTEAHSTQRDQPPRMHGPGLWMYEQKEQMQYVYKHSMNERSQVITGVEFNSTAAMQGAHHIIHLI